MFTIQLTPDVRQYIAEIVPQPNGHWAVHDNLGGESLHDTKDEAASEIERRCKAEVARQLNELSSAQWGNIATFGLLHSGVNHQGLQVSLERTGDPDIYSEARIGIHTHQCECVADVLVGYSEAGELRVLVTTDADGNSDHSYAIYPMRSKDEAVTAWGG